MASILKVDTIQDQSGNNIINENAWNEQIKNWELKENNNAT